MNSVWSDLAVSTAYILLALIPLGSVMADSDWNIGLVAEIPLDVTDFLVDGDCLYIAGDYGVRLVDISVTETPTVVWSIETSGCPVGLELIGTQLYVTERDAQSEDTYLRTLDVSDITRPKQIAFSSTSGLISCIGDGYACSVSTEGLQIMDTSNLHNIQTSAKYTVDQFHWLTAVSARGNYVYIATLKLPALNCPTLVILDVSDTSRPREIASYLLPDVPEEMAFIREMFVYGNYLLLGGNGLWAVDISNAVEPLAFWKADTLVRAICAAEDIICVANEVGIIMFAASDLGDIHRIGFYSMALVKRLCFSEDIIYASTGAAPLRLLTYSGDLNTQLKHIGHCRIFGQPEDVVVRGSYAYVASGQSGLQIVDVSDPVAPRMLGKCNTPGYAVGVCITGGYAHVADSEAGLCCIDVSDPNAPVEVRSFSDLGNVQVVASDPNHLYVGSQDLHIFHLTIPEAPTHLASLALAPPVGEGAYITGPINGLSLYGHLAFISGASSALPTRAGSTRIVDVSDTSDPRELSSINVGREQIQVIDGYCYIADGDDGLQVIDVSNPRSPQVLPKLSLRGYTRGLYAQGTRLYVSSGNSLYVFDISDGNCPRMVTVRDDISSLVGCRGVFVMGSYIYLTDAAGLAVLTCKSDADFEPLFCDLNADGVVDISDLMIVGQYLGTTSAPTSYADLNGDGEVNILDLVIVARNFSEGTGR